MSGHSIEDYVRRQSTNQLLAILDVYLSGGRYSDYQPSLPAIISVLETRSDTDMQRAGEVLEKVRDKMKEDEKRDTADPVKAK